MATFQTKEELRIAVNEWCDGNTDELTKKYGHISYWTTELITNMSGLFRDKYNFNEPLYWDTSNVTAMRFMFCEALNFNQELKFNTSNVTDMRYMFCDALNFNQELKFNTSKVTDMRYMFRGAYNFNQELKFDTSNVTNMGSMFCNAFNFNQELKFDTSKVTNNMYMFTHAYNIETLNFLLENNQKIKLSKNIKIMDFIKVYNLLYEKNKLTSEIKEKCDEMIEKIRKIQNWWKWDVYYHPYTKVGIRRLEKEYDMLFGKND